MYNNERLRKSIGQNGLEYFENNHSYKSGIEGLEEIFRVFGSCHRIGEIAPYNYNDQVAPS